MFTGEELQIKKYRGDLIDRRGRVKLGVSQHTVPSVPVSGDRGGNQKQEQRGQGKSQRTDERAIGTGTGGESPEQSYRE